MPRYSQTFVCDEHASEKLQTSYRDQLLIGIVLASKMDNLKVEAHREVLYASSEHFLAISSNAVKENSLDVIYLEIDGATLKVVVDFIYSGTIELRGENVARILAAADILRLSTLTAACLNFVEKTMDVTNWLTIVSTPKQQQSAELDKKAFQFALQNFEELSKKKEFLQLTEEQLSKLISSDDLCVNSEETVFHSVVSWVKHDNGRREESTISLLSHIRFSLLTPEFIIDNRHSLSKTYECLELLFCWLESHLSQTKLTKWHSNRRKANSEKGRDTIGFLTGQCAPRSESLKLQFLDPKSNIWIYEDLPRSPNRNPLCSVIVAKDKLITVGGAVGSYEVSNIVECLDLRTKKWTSLPPMRQARHSPGLAVFGDNLYAIGGFYLVDWLCSVESYNFHTRKWQELAPMPSAKAEAQVIVEGYQLYVVDHGNNPIKCYDTIENYWTELPPKNHSSTEYGINYGIVFDSIYLYAVGGIINGKICKTVECYSRWTRRWEVINSDIGQSIGSLNCIHWRFQGRVGRESLVCCFFNENSYQKSLEEYDIEGNKWRTLVALPELPDCYLFKYKYE